jgi:XTP/dITP diphosphohydrolase
MRNIIVASNNEHKIKEIKEILSGMPLRVISLKEAGIDVDVVEDGSTFVENARKKAVEIYELIEDKDSYLVMADDSGLEVEALGGAPGVYSARFAGEHGNSRKNNEKLLTLLQGLPFEKRGAEFVCSIVVVASGGRTIEVEGRVPGFITTEEKGKDGFGYDPLFFVPGFKKTFAEMTSEEKNSLSHRGRALENMVKRLQEVL